LKRWHSYIYTCIYHIHLDHIIFCIYFHIQEQSPPSIPNIYEVYIYMPHLHSYIHIYLHTSAFNTSYISSPKLYHKKCKNHIFHLILKSNNTKPKHNQKAQHTKNQSQLQGKFNDNCFIRTTIQKKKHLILNAALCHAYLFTLTEAYTRWSTNLSRSFQKHNHHQTQLTHFNCFTLCISSEHLRRDNFICNVYIFLSIVYIYIPIYIHALYTKASALLQMQMQCNGECLLLITK